MFTFESGVLDKTRLVSNILMLLLLVGNIFFSVQYIGNIELQKIKDNHRDEQRIATAHFMKFFIDKVIDTQGTVSFDDRVKLENDVRQLQDAQITMQWENFVQSKDSKTAQQNVVKLMSLLTNKMI